MHIENAHNNFKSFKHVFHIKIQSTPSTTWYVIVLKLKKIKQKEYMYICVTVIETYKFDSKITLYSGKKSI